MLTCVPPFLSQKLVVHTLKNYIKVPFSSAHLFFKRRSYWTVYNRYNLQLEHNFQGFLTMFIGIPYLTMCASHTEMAQVSPHQHLYFYIIYICTKYQANV